MSQSDEWKKLIKKFFESGVKTTQNQLNSLSKWPQNAILSDKNEKKKNIIHWLSKADRDHSFNRNQSIFFLNFNSVSSIKCTQDEHTRTH